MDHRNGREGECEDGDVVFLTVSLGGAGNGFGGLGAEISGALEAEEFA
jgi:hypothetical protein